MKVAIHVEADDAKVVGSGNVRDDALSTPALFRHPHPHVPIPELFRCGPLGLKLLLVQGPPEHPAQTRHGLHTVQQCWVLSRVFIPLVIPSRDAVQAVILLQQVDGLAQETEKSTAMSRSSSRTTANLASGNRLKVAVRLAL